MISELLYKMLSNDQFKQWAKSFHKYKKYLTFPISELQCKKLLVKKMGINKGDSVAVHSSIDKLNLRFSVYRLLEILIEAVGEEGNLLFPCWSYLGRTEDFVNQKDIIFEAKNDTSCLGLLTELARRHPKAFRSNHPTASVCVIGKNAAELTATHHLDNFPCGVESPYYKMLALNAKVIGLGEKPITLTLLHCVEDVFRQDFPFETKNEKMATIPVKMLDGNSFICETFYQKNLFDKMQIVPFLNKNVSKKACFTFSYKNTNFFVCNAPLFFEEMKLLTLQGKTIYGDFQND